MHLESLSDIYLHDGELCVVAVPGCDGGRRPLERRLQARGRRGQPRRGTKHLLRDGTCILSIDSVTC